MLKNKLFLIIFIQILFSNKISIPIMQIEGEYKQRYTSALNSVIGPESFYIEVNAVLQQDTPKKIADIPINFLPGLGIKTTLIPKEIKSNKLDSYKSIKSLNIILTLETRLSDSSVTVATETIKNHILYEKIKNNLIINRSPLYKSPEIIPVDVVWPINTYNTEEDTKSILSNKSILGSFLIGLFIVLGVIILIFFINKLYKKFIDFSQSQLEGQNAVRLALEEGLSNSELLEENNAVAEEIKQDQEKIEVSPQTIPTINQDIPIENKVSNLDSDLETTFREVGADIIEAISNIAEPVTTSVKEAISESTSLDLQQHNPFDFISYLDIDLNKKIFMNENEGSSAVVLSHLEPKKASEILSSLHVDTRLKIAQHMATMEGTSKEILNSVKTKFKNKVKELLKPDFTPINGIDILSDILNEMNQEDSESILFSIAQTNKTISDSIRKNIGYFNDILTLNNSQIDQLIQNIDTNTLANSLVESEDSIQEKIFNSLSTSGQFALKRRIQLVENSDSLSIQLAQKKVGEKIITILENNNE